MERNIGKITAITAEQIKNYAHRLLKDIPEEIYSTKPNINGKLIETNHPAFHLGHLCLYPYRISSLLNLNLEELKPSDKYVELFLKDVPCVNDPERKIYPSKKELEDLFFKGFQKINQILPTISDQILLEQNIEEKTKERFPILGSFIIYISTSHISTHLGQISVWRRCFDLPAA